jgi:hypothetical protein
MSIRLVTRALATLVTATAVVTPVVSVLASGSHGRTGSGVTLTRAAIPSLGVLSIDPVPAPAPAPVPTAADTRPVAQLPLEPLGARTVILYGDSLAWQAQDFFVAALAGAGITRVTTRTFGGTAICDWLTRMQSDAVTLHPDAVVVEFSGNALTPCMRALDGQALSGPAYFAKYAADAKAVLDIFTPGHTLVFFAGSPISHRAELTNDPTVPTLHAMYAELAASNPYGRYTDAGASVLSGGHWTETLPCLPTEPCTGGRDAHGTPVNVVRAPDGAHFCPGAPAAVRGVTAACSVWSSGSYRFGNAMAAAVIEELASRQAA